MECGWAHSCCSQQELVSALSNSKIHSIESDIVLSSRTNHPVMAHPPATDSDLPFEEFLAISLATSSSKNLKLDFKSPVCVPLCLPSLAIHSNAIARKDMVIYLNADVLPGTGIVDALLVPFDADTFVSECRQGFPAGILSLGWKVDLSKTVCFLTGSEALY